MMLTFVLFFRHYIEATRNMQNYHRLFWASQERYDKLVNLSSSGGAAGFRTVDVPEGSDTVFEAASALADSNKNGVHKNGETEPAPQVDSGIDIGGDVQANGGLGSSTRSPEQNNNNGGSKHESNSSPGLSRRQRTLKPVTDKSTSKGSVEKSSSSGKDNKEKPSPSGRTATEKTQNGRTIVEKTSANSSTSNSHVFTVPKPPGPRKGARRPLHVDFAVSSKAGTSNGANTSTVTHGVTSSGISASGISESTSRRTQSRLVLHAGILTTSELPFASVSKRGLLQNFSEAKSYSEYSAVYCNPSLTLALISLNERDFESCARLQEELNPVYEPISCREHIVFLSASECGQISYAFFMRRLRFLSARDRLGKQTIPSCFEF